MSEIDRGLASTNTAEIYETYYVPGVFAQWADRVVETAQLCAGQRVLDVACGSGVLARAAAQRVGIAGSVTGFDKNAAMLAVAQQRNPTIDWQQGTAESLPFPDDHFDAVVSQFGIMFFENRRRAIQEMIRVLKPGGRLAIAVWASLEDSPGDAEMAKLVRRLFGDKAAQTLGAPFALGDVQRFRDLFEDVQLADVTVMSLPGNSRFDSLKIWVNWVYTDIRSMVVPEGATGAAEMTTEGNDEKLFSRLLQAATTELQQFVTQDGHVEFASPAHILSAVKARPSQ